MKLDVRTSAGASAQAIDVDDEVFGIEPNTAVVHQALVAQLAARRAGSANTKTRGEVSGGGAKPWRQKGTGRARPGTIRAPQFSGGGHAFARLTAATGVGNSSGSIGISTIAGLPHPSAAFIASATWSGCST